MLKKVALIIGLCFSFLLVAYPAMTSQTSAHGQDKNARRRQLYMTYCSSCHGTDGKGGGPAASALKTPLPDLTRIAKQDGKFPELRIQRIIIGDVLIYGHGSREMPVWGRLFEDKSHGQLASIGEVYSLTKYIESIQAK